MKVEIPDWKKAKYITEMSIIADESKDDPELAHSKADDLLCTILKECGFSEVEKEFERCEKWYS